MRQVWDAKGQLKYLPDYTIQTAGVLFEAVVKGYLTAIKGKPTNAAVQLAASYPDVTTGYGPDIGMLTQMELNTFRFSASKSWEMAKELNGLLPDSPTFGEFKKKAAPILGQYNVNYLKTEYDTAYATAQNNARYYELLRLKDTYKSWRYMTVGDNRVRPAHRALHGRVFKANDPAFDAIYPPNGWGCRCYVEAVNDEPNTTYDDAVQLLQEEPATPDKSTWDVMVEGGWNKNRAKRAEIYSSNQMYAKEFDASFGVKDNALIPGAELKPETYKPTPIVERTSEDASKWIAEKAPNNILYDYLGRPLIITDEQFTKKTTGPKYAEFLKRQNYLDAMLETITDPQEVYYEQKRIPKGNYPGTYDIYYYRFYKETAFKVVTTIDEEFNINIKTWHIVQYDKNLDSQRKGILMKKAPKY